MITFVTKKLLNNSQMDISNRIQELIRKNQLNAAKFADRIGVQRSNLSHVLTGRNKPGLDFIEKVLLEFPDIDANWLISGKKQLGEGAGRAITNENLQTTSVGDENLPDNSERKNPSTSVQSGKESAKVDKIIVFYKDNTFEEFKK